MRNDVKKECNELFGFTVWIGLPLLFVHAGRYSNTPLQIVHSSIEYDISRPLAYSPLEVMHRLYLLLLLLLQSYLLFDYTKTLLWCLLLCWCCWYPSIYQSTSCWLFKKVYDDRSIESVIASLVRCAINSIIIVCLKLFITINGSPMWIVRMVLF